MTLAERLPSLDDAQLATLHANAVRLQTEGGERGVAAAGLIPLIEQELAQRPAKATKRAKPAAKPAAKSAAKPASKRAAKSSPSEA